MKLVVVDIDGTLIDSPSQTEPSDAFSATVSSLRDTMLVTCASGRSFTWAKPVLDKAQFTAPPIISGGTRILNPKNLKVEHDYPIASEQLAEIKKILQKYPEHSIIFNDYLPHEYIEGGWNQSRLHEIEECYILAVLYVTNEQADKLLDEFSVLKNVAVIKMNSLRPGLLDIHIVNHIATKEHAIKILQKELNIPKEDTIGIGDGFNDIHLFNSVGTKIAVANAVDELKELADEVIGSVQEDAVTTYLQRFLPQ